MNGASPAEYSRSTACVPVLEQEVELAEDLGQVGPVDLVDDEHEGLVGVAAGRVTSWRRGRASARSRWARASAARPVALEEVLVGVRRVELHQLDLLGADQVVGQCRAMKVLPVPGGP